MRVLRDPRACDVDGPTAITIGFYDGVHRGHRQVITEVRDMARDRGLASAVVTFDRHPAQIVRPESAPPLLTDLEQKLELLATTGVDYCLVVPFDHDRSKETADEFVDEVITGCMQAQVVVVGEDFHFGHQRQGNVALLERRGSDLGFEVVGLGLVGLNGQQARDHEQVSSSAIRRALARGDLDVANRMLSRPYEVRGTVERGDGNGRQLGFPTANVTVDPSILLPADGVYAGWYERPDATVHAAAISVGTRPTFYDEHGLLVMEAHVLDLDEDLYGEAAEVRFVHHLRGQQKFDGVDALVEQMHADVADARRLLAVV